MKYLKIWEKIKEEPFRVGFRKLLKRTFKLPDGKVVDFDVKHEGPAVCILVFTTNNKIILAKQFRPGPEKVLFEMPGGVIEKGEEPKQAAKRELLEETGYSGDLKFVGTSLDCAYSTMIRYVFVATNCQKTQEQKLDDTEFVDVIEVTLEDFRKHLRTGELTDVECGYLGLDYLGLL
ncbi:MAG: NUDIX hydrolase [Oligoflexia bacterium]|nr:NUDIX hydrolase [Oligoflexia bacterium]